VKTKTTVFYCLMATVLLAAFGRAIYLSKNVEVRNQGVIDQLLLTPAGREAEFQVLRTETSQPVHSARQYFDLVKRLYVLESSYFQADRDSQADIVERGRVMSVRSLLMGSLMEQVRNYNLHADPEFDSLQASTSKLLNSGYVMDGRMPAAWGLFYFLGLGLTFIHFSIRYRMMGGRLELMLTDWRCPMWLIVWPVGIFRYPRAMDIQAQFIRAYRFAVFLLSSSLSLFAAGCAGKRVRTEPDPAKLVQARSWQLDASTSFWPAYLGANGGIFHPGAVQQSSVTVSHGPSGTYAGVWFSEPLTERGLVPNFGHELDLFGGWGSTFHGLNVGANVLYVDVTPVGKYRGNVYLFSGSVGRQIFSVGSHSLRAQFTAQGNVPAKGTTPARGLNLRHRLSYAWSISKSLSAQSYAEFTHDSGALGFQRGWYSLYGSSLIWRMPGGFALQGQLRGAIPLTVSDRKKVVQAGLSFAWSR